LTEQEERFDKESFSWSRHFLRVEGAIMTRASGLFLIAVSHLLFAAGGGALT
jgi:hypothetical protein